VAQSFAERTSPNCGKCALTNIWPIAIVSAVRIKGNNLREREHSSVASPLTLVHATYILVNPHRRCNVQKSLWAPPSSPSSCSASSGGSWPSSARSSSQRTQTEGEWNGMQFIHLVLFVGVRHLILRVCVRHLIIFASVRHLILCVSVRHLIIFVSVRHVIQFVCVRDLIIFVCV
jgi:hypothetical protein